MALDGVALFAIKKELEDSILQAKVDKIYQPLKDELVILFRAASGNRMLLISASSNAPRIHFIEDKKENPITAPMFCMLLRKHLTGGRLIKINQVGLERVLQLVFECRNELSEVVERSIYVEIMGKHSNIILVGDNNIILDSIKHIDFTVSSKRQVLPGLKYECAPAQNKVNITAEQFDIEKILENPEKRLNNAILNYFEGLSPIVCRELCYRACSNSDIICSQVDETIKTKLIYHLNNLNELIHKGEFSPVLIKQPNGKMVDFSFFNITQYSTAALVTGYESFSKMLCDYYEKSSSDDALRQKAADILKIISNSLERANRKYNNQLMEQELCKDMEDYKIKGELITANMHSISKGDIKLVCCDYYQPDMPQVEIELDARYTPNQNAQMYYKKYRKLKTKSTLLVEQIKASRNEIDYLESVFDSLANAEGEKDIAQIRNELAGGRYIKSSKVLKKTKNEKVSVNSYISSDGFKITYGKNNVQNDYVTMKLARNCDIWLHTKNIPSSHVIISTNGVQVPDTTMLEAAKICAYHSKAKESENVAVDYTLVKNVSKPSGAKPGMVIYVNYKTMYVTPDKEINLKKE